MFRKNKKDNRVDTADSIVSSSRKTPPSIFSKELRLLGNVVSDGMVDVDGRIEGNLTAQTVFIRDNGVVMGDVNSAVEVHIFGTVHGVIKCPTVCIYGKAHIEGVILHSSLTIEDGAYVNAQFKPFDAQVRLGEPGDMTTAEEDKAEYDIFRDLKLIS